MPEKDIPQQDYEAFKNAVDLRNAENARLSEIARRPFESMADEALNDHDYKEAERMFDIRQGQVVRTEDQAFANKEHNLDKYIAQAKNEAKGKKIKLDDHTQSQVDRLSDHR